MRTHVGRQAQLGNTFAVNRFAARRDERPSARQLQVYGLFAGKHWLICPWHVNAPEQSFGKVQ